MASASTTSSGSISPFANEDADWVKGLSASIALLADALVPISAHPITEATITSRIEVLTGELSNPGTPRFVDVFPLCSIPNISRWTLPSMASGG
jgi:hypothetical protein